MDLLFKDLTANLTDSQREGLAIGVYVIVALTAIVVSGVLPLLPASGLPIALIGGAVALRIAGPKDAKSFRLYR